MLGVGHAQAEEEQRKQPTRRRQPGSPAHQHEDDDAQARTLAVELGRLAVALEQAGARVKILDFVVYPYSRAGLETAAKSFKPHIAGATAVTMTFDHASRVLKDLKTIAPEILTVMGGPHVTFRARETLEETPQLDVVVLGEGEQTMVELSQRRCFSSGF